MIVVEQVVQQIVNALTLSSLYVTFALGMTLIYSIMRILHIAHGIMIIAGAYSTLLLLPLLGNNIIISALIGTLMTGVLGLVLGLGLYVPLVRRGYVNETLLVSTAMLIAGIEVVNLFLGPEHHQYPKPANLQTINFFGINVFMIQILSAFVSFVSVAVLWIYLNRTNEGRALEAVSQDLQLALLQGINSLKSYGIALFVGSLFGGLSGVLLSLYYNDVYPGLGSYPVLVGLCIIIVGGLGSFGGTIVAGLIIAFSEVFVITYFPFQLPRTLIAFAVLLIVLLLKPEGLLGRGKK